MSCAASCNTNLQHAAIGLSRKGWTVSNPVVGAASQQLEDQVDEMASSKIADSLAAEADGGYTIGEQYEWTEQSELQWWLDVISQGPSWRPIGS